MDSKNFNNFEKRDKTRWYKKLSRHLGVVEKAEKYQRRKNECRTKKNF